MEGALITLAVLACPIGMGLMMWFMARGMRGDRDESPGERPQEVSLAELQAEQARLGAEVERLEAAAHGAREPAASGSREGS